MNIPDKNFEKCFSAENFQSIEETVSSLTSIIENINEKNYNFLSIAFHDLRNPLTYIKMSLDVLFLGSFGELSEEQKGVIQKAISQVDRLNKIIDDVLLTAKLKNNKLPLAFSSINIRNIIEDALKINKELIEKKQLTVTKNISEDIPNSAIDYKNLSLAFNYLVNYCVKSTEKGEISVSCFTNDTNDNIIVEIKDTSDSIGKENIPAVFEEFKCFGMMAKHKEERTGLELSISKEVIEKHKGAIEFETNEINGNQFKIMLPL